MKSRLQAIACGLIAALLSILWATSSVALEDHVLWLPASYQELEPRLHSAAVKLEATERCQRLMRGSLHESSRSVDEAVFLLVCRDSERKTYAVLADANTLEFFSVRSAESLAARRGGDLAKVQQEQLQHMRFECDKLFARKTRFMKNLKRIATPQPEAVRGENGEVSLFIYFDAHSMQGNPLNYQATCTSAEVDGPVEFTIRARQPAPESLP